MTPKEKARELVDKFLPILFGAKPLYKKSDYFKSKHCALIAVDEMLSLRYLLKKETWFYKEVKKEIEKL